MACTVIWAEIDFSQALASWKNNRQLVTMFHTVNLLGGCVARALAVSQSLGNLVSGTSSRIYAFLVS